MKKYDFSAFTLAFGVTAGIILDLPLLAQSCVYVVCDGDIYVFRYFESLGEYVPLFKCERVRELPSMFRAYLTGEQVREFEQIGR